MTHGYAATNACPVCKDQRLVPTQLEPHLPAHRCDRCGGHWVRGQEYFRWLEHPDRASQATPDQPIGEVHDTARAMLCPDCGRMLVRYRVGHGIEFHLNHCGGCGGIWLDANEWETLRQSQLTDRVHRIFSAAWQGRIEHDRQQQARDTLLRERVGEADFERLRETLRWMEAHDRRQEMVAYLLERTRGPG